MKLSTLLKSALATSMAATLVVSHTVSADTVRLRFHTFYGTEVDAIARQLQERVQEASDGSLRIQFFRGGELVDSDQFVDAVARGTIDIAHGVGSYWPGRVGIGTIEGGLPGAWVSVDEARAIFADQGLDELVAEAYEEQGVKLIGRGFGSDYGLLTREPVSSLDDLRTMRIRATSSIAAILEQFDVPTVFLPGQELYVALSTGVIDGAIYGGPVEYEQLKLNEVAKHYTDINLLNPGWTENALVNPRTWERLSEAQQRILTEAIDQYLLDVHQWLEEGNRAVLEAGDVFEYAVLPEAESNRLAEAALPIWQAEAEKSERNARAVEILIDNAIAQGRLSE